MSKTLESVSALIAISSSDLAAVTGGRLPAEPSGGGGAAPPVPALPACPTGTSPDFTYINGNLNVKTPVGAGASGAGTYIHYECKPVPKQ
jgi:hypothetical protein